MKFLTGKAIWARIGRLARGTDQAFVAVPYLGEGAAKMLPLKRGSLLLTRYEIGALKAGQISPDDVIQLLNRGVRVFSAPALHAKIYAFPKCVIIGSSNASKTSRDRLIEACFESSDSTAIAEAKSYIKKHAKFEITHEYALELAPHYRKPQHFPMAPGPAAPGAKGRRVARGDVSDHALWLLSTEPLIDASTEWHAASKAALADARKLIGRNTRLALDTLAWTGEAREKLALGDNIIIRMADEKGVDWVWPPAIVHSIKKAQGRDSYAIAYSTPKTGKKLRLETVQKKIGDSSKSLVNLKSAMRKASPQTRADLLGLWAAPKQ